MGKIEIGPFSLLEKILRWCTRQKINTDAVIRYQVFKGTVTLWIQALEPLSSLTVGDSLFIIGTYLSLKLFLCIIDPREKGDCILQPDVTVLLHKLESGKNPKQNKTKWETSSKEGNTKQNTKAVLLTDSSRFGMCQNDACCILQCPCPVWVMWIAFMGVSDVNFKVQL